MILTDVTFAEEIFSWFIDNASYLMIFLFMMIESSFIPFPSEVVVPPAAYLACTGDELNFWLVIVFATLGALAGAFINYYLSLWIGRPLVYRFADSRLGHACLITREKVEKAEKYFDRHGAVSTFVGRLIPGIRQLISIPAGLARMNVVIFTIFTFLGAFIWNGILGGLGYWLAQHQTREQLFDSIEKYNSYLSWGGVAIGAVFLFIILWNTFKPNKK